MVRGVYEPPFAFSPIRSRAALPGDRRGDLV